MNIREKFEVYKKANEELDLIKKEVVKSWVSFYCEREEIHIGDEYQDYRGKGTITRIDSTVNGDITVYWKKHKKDGELHNNETVAYTTGKYVLW